MDDLTEFRKAKDEFFAHHPQSPLTAEQKRNFEGLQYYPYNKDLSLEVTVQPFEDQQRLQMQTSTGDIQSYIRYGRFTFNVDGQQAALTLFASDHGYFLPFVDAQAGRETYGAGRYLDPEPLGGNHFLVDFNLAYNPYCAYNELWSCPLPPAENRLQVSIQAGEKNYENGPSSSHGYG